MAKDPFCFSSPSTAILFQESTLPVPSLFSSPYASSSSFTTSSLSHSPLSSSLSSPSSSPHLLSEPHLWRTMANEASPLQAVLSMNHSAPLPALDEEPTNLEKSDFTHAGKFPSNLEGKFWCCKGWAGTSDRIGGGARQGSSWTSHVLGKETVVWETLGRHQGFSVTAIPGFFLEDFAADTLHCDNHYLLLLSFCGTNPG